MKLVILALDEKSTDPHSAVAQRLVAYGAIVEQIDVVVPSTRRSVARLSSNVVVHGVSGFSKFVQLFRLFSTSSKLITQNKSDVISSQDPYYLGFVAYLVSVFFNRALEIQIHGFDQANFFKRIVARIVIPRAHSIRVVSERIRRALVEKFHVAPERIIVCPIYVNCQDFKNKNDVIKAPDRSVFTFVTVSRLVSIKNIPLQLRALAQLKKEGIAARLRIVGDGEERDMLVRMCQQLDIQDSVDFTGYVSNPSSELSSADCFLLTSHDEGYGLAAIEAACAGLLVIMTDVGCAGEVILDNENGLIIPVNDEDALVDAMKRIISDDALRSTIIQNNTTLFDPCGSHLKPCFYNLCRRDSLIQPGKSHIIATLHA